MPQGGPSSLLRRACRRYRRTDGEQTADPLPRRGAQMNETRGERRTIGVFLLDDHEIVRLGGRELLEAEPGIEVVGEAGTAASALARIPALRPDAAILGVRLPD